MPYCLYASLSFALSLEPQPESMPAVSATVSVSAINLFFIIIVLHVYILPLIIYVFDKLVNPALTFLLRPAVHGEAGPVTYTLS